jgi:hypothetical protein
MLSISRCFIYIYIDSAYYHWGRRGRNRMAVGFTTTCAKSVTITTYSSNPVHGEVYSIQHYVTYFFMEEMGGVSGKNQRPSCSELLTTLSLKTISNSPRHEQELNTFVVIRLT